MKKLFRSFLICGIAGWCLEILYTAIDALRRRKFHLTGTTSLFMFPIYGSFALLQPFVAFLKKFPPLIRGSFYALLIFTGELISGRLLLKKGLCPWTYENARWRILDVIRLDYFPHWLLTGLLFEKILNACRKSS